MSGSTECCFTSGWDLIGYVIYCHILWWIFYYFLLLVTRQSEEWCCRFLTLIHGSLISYLAITDIFINRHPIDFSCMPLTPAKKNYLSFMLSYFLFDFCWIHFFGNEAWVIYAHHASSILIILNLMYKNYGGAGLSYGVAGLELTNPYLQLRWFLRTHGYLNKPIHTITELWFMGLFFIIRMIAGTVLLYHSLFSKTDLDMKLSFLSIYGISLVLQWQIFVYFRKKYLKGGALPGVCFINSRVSISPYFQRRTLDNRADGDGQDDSESGEAEQVVMAISATLTTEVFLAKEAETTEKAIASSFAENAKNDPTSVEQGLASAQQERIPEESPQENPDENPSEEDD